MVGLNFGPTTGLSRMNVVNWPSGGVAEMRIHKPQYVKGYFGFAIEFDSWADGPCIHFAFAKWMFSVSFPRKS
jgi:hypothetical protein